MFACSKPGADKSIEGGGFAGNEPGGAIDALLDAFEKLTEGRFDEAIAAFSACKEQPGEAGIAIGIGMGKAYFGAGDYQNAVEAFETAYSIDPERNDIIHYIGEAQMRAGDFDASAETFKLLMGNHPNDKAAKGKLEQALRKNKDYSGLHRFYEDRLEEAGGQNSPETNYYSGKLMEAAQLSKDGSLIHSTMERLNALPLGFALETGYKAYGMFVSGEEDAAKALMFDAGNIDALLEAAGENGCYFGEFSDAGEYRGKGLIIYGSKSVNAVCRVYIGEFSGNRPNGEGTGYSGHAGEYTDLEGGKVAFENGTYIEAAWKDGAPDGRVVMIDEYSEHSGGVALYSRKTVETAEYKNRLAQGEVWSETRYRDHEGAQEDSVTITKHVAKNGRPAPFEANIGGRTVMAYEARYVEAAGDPYEANEEECRKCMFAL